MPHKTLHAIVLASALLVPPGGALAQPRDMAAAMTGWPQPDLRAGRTDPQIAAAITAYARQLHDAGHFSGVVLAAKAGKLIVAQPYGLADVAAGSPNTLDTRFNIGSITKLFTKLAIAQLAAAGKLSLDDTLKTHLPALPVPSADRITLRQLLEHRSGMGDIFGPRFEAAQPARLRELADFIPLFADQPLAFEPGSDEQYSNAGYVVLGLVIERITGQTYRDYVARRIFAPAGMTATGFWARDEHTPAIATGYTHVGLHGDHPELVPNTDTLSGRPSSAGGAFATAGDLLRFWQALQTNQLASPTWTRWVIGAAAPSDRPPEPAGGAPASPPRPLKQMLGGGAPGVNAAVQVDGDWIVIALANLDAPAAFAMARGAVEIIHGRREPDLQIRPGMHRVSPPPPDAPPATRRPDRLP